jgi:hypothetical protein
LLLKWDGWNPPARRFLDQSEATLEIQATFSDYHARVKVFYDLLYDKHQEWFAAEISEMDHLFSVAVELEKKREESRPPPT